eukprot:1529333-Amphidinium_carterae.1
MCRGASQLAFTLRQQLLPGKPDGSPTCSGKVAGNSSAALDYGTHHSFGNNIHSSYDACIVLGQQCL